MIRAYIMEDRLRFSVALALIQQDDDGTPKQIMRIHEAGDNPVIEWEDLADRNANIEPTIRFSDSEARAILEALTIHYRGAEDTQALRRDYDQERGRVDQLTVSLASIAQALATR